MAAFSTKICTEARDPLPRKLCSVLQRFIVVEPGGGDQGPILISPRDFLLYDLTNAPGVRNQGKSLT